jgi:hypothetical protein
VVAPCTSTTAQRQLKVSDRFVITGDISGVSLFSDFLVLSTSALENRSRPQRSSRALSGQIVAVIVCESLCDESLPEQK